MKREFLKIVTIIRKTEETSKKLNIDISFKQIDTETVSGISEILKNKELSMSKVLILPDKALYNRNNINQLKNSFIWSLLCFTCYLLDGSTFSMKRATLKLRFTAHLTPPFHK